MASKFASDFNHKPLHVSAYGNAWSEDYSFTGAGAVGDKIYLGIIPAGIRVQSVSLITGAGGASASIKLGFEPVDAAPLADDDAFGTIDVAAAGRTDSAVAPITFDGPVKLVATVVAAVASTTLTALVAGKVVGVK